MPLIMGLDPSLDKAGYCILDTDKPFSHFVARGRFKSFTSDGILVQRLVKQASQFQGILQEYGISFVSMEAPYFGGNESEHLFALNQFLHKVFLDNGTYVICFPPTQLKMLANPEYKGEVFKARMIATAKDLYELHGKTLVDDEADSLMAGYVGKHFYRCHIEEKTKPSDLPAKMADAFFGKHTFVRGPKKGATEYTGLIYRENELWYDFKRIKERKEEYAPEEERRSRFEKQDSDKRSY